MRFLSAGLLLAGLAALALERPVWCICLAGAGLALFRWWTKRHP